MLNVCCFISYLLLLLYSTIRFTLQLYVDTHSLFSIHFSLHFAPYADGTIKFIRSQKKNAQLVYKDYIYNKKLTQANGQTTWRCADVLKLRCKAVVITKNGEFVDARRHHNHESHAGRIGQRQLYKIEEELEEYIEICTSNPKISQYLSSSNISIMTAKDGKECKLFVPASEATEIEMQALVDAADDDDMIEQVVELKPIHRLSMHKNKLH